MGITGSPSPMELYSLDIDYMSLRVDESKAMSAITWNTRQRFKARQFLENEKSQNMSDSSRNMLKHLEYDENFAVMRKIYTVEFLQLYNMGYQNYSQGEWQAAA